MATRIRKVKLGFRHCLFQNTGLKTAPPLLEKIFKSVMQQENKTPSYSGTTVLHRRECLPIKKKKKVKIDPKNWIGFQKTISPDIYKNMKS